MFSYLIILFYCEIFTYGAQDLARQVTTATQAQATLIVSAGLIIVSSIGYLIVFILSSVIQLLDFSLDNDRSQGGRSLQEDLLDDVTRYFSADIFLPIVFPNSFLAAGCRLQWTASGKRIFLIKSEKQR